MGITEATLECPNGMIRHVKLQQRITGLYFQDGWKDFVQDHLLQKHDLLVFTYEGGEKFSLEIYDQSACEKKDECTKKSPLQLNLYDQRKKQSTKQRMNESLDMTLSSCKETSEGETQSHDNSSEHVQQKSAGQGFAFDSVQDQCTDPSLDGFLETKMARFKGSSSNKGLRRQPRPAGNNGGAHEKANSFSSKFPHFTVELKSNGLVCIPSAISMQYLPRQRGQVTLQGPDGRLWDVRYIWSQNRAILSGGLLAFTRDHGLVPGDLGVFELLDKNKFRVHIFRAAESQVS